MVTQSMFKLCMIKNKIKLVAYIKLPLMWGQKPKRCHVFGKKKCQGVESLDLKRN